ncbi:HEPN domain-containing protein, partial [Vibrio parahaemolyticus]
KKGTVTTEQARINIPSVMRIVVEDEEKNKLQKIFSSPTQRLLSALSFVAHSWTFHERDRFINQVIALDALYGIDRENKSAIVRGVSRDAGKISDVAGKIDLIYTFRNKFVHGEVPSLAKHNKYKHFIQ